MRRGATILTYHTIGACPDGDDAASLFVPSTCFREQMKRIRRRVVPLGDAARARGSAVVLTFDDGYRNVLSEAGPILAEYRLPATVFIPTAWIGRRNPEIASSCPLDVLSREELLAAEECGIRVESHGHDHIDYSRATEAEIRADLETSASVFETILGRRPRFLAYPYGRSSYRAREIVMEMGLEAAFSIDARGHGPYARERTQVTRSDGPALFTLKSSGLYLPLRRSRLGGMVYTAARPLVRRARDRGATNARKPC